MILVTQVNDEYQIRFPYDANIIEIVKSVPGRRWNPEGKFWSVPTARLGFLIQHFKGTIYENQIQIQSHEDINVNATLNEKQNIPDIDISEYKYRIAEGLKPYQHQLDSLKFYKYRYTHGLPSGFVLADEMGGGKALTLDTPIPTPSGYVQMKDICVGDKVFDENGQLTTVTNTYFHQNLEMYKVTFTDDTYVCCCKDHLWYFQKDGEWRTWPLSKIISGSNYGPKCTTLENRLKSYHIPRNSCVQYPHKNIVIPPWVLGALIGDGSLTSGLGFTSSYDFIVNEMRKQLPNYLILNQCGDIEYNIAIHPEHRTVVKCIETGQTWTSVVQANIDTGISVDNALSRNNGYSFKLRKTFIKEGLVQNPFIQELKKLGLFECNSYSKFIPDIYKFNSKEVRLALLQGLMDTDGYADKHNHHSYSTVSSRLAYDVAELVRGLGGYAKVVKSQSNYNDHNYTFWQVTVVLDDCRQLYNANILKKDRASNRHFRPRKTFKSIEYIGNMPGKCITVDSPSHLYLCKDYIVTHNTVQLMNIALHMRENYGAKHCLIIACVNSAKYNWVEDIIKHTNGHETPYILGSHLKRNGEVAAPTESEPKLTDLMNMTMYGKKDGEPLPYFIVLNIEAIRMRKGKTYPIAERLIELISKKEISLIALDEIHRNCLEYNTLIQTDEGSVKIGEIVENKLKVNVLSYDTNSNQLVYCPVVDWHTNTTKSKLIELIIQEGERTSVITCTPDHEFYTTNRGWVAASELNEYDDIVFNKESQ